MVWSQKFSTTTKIFLVLPVEIFSWIRNTDLNKFLVSLFWMVFIRRRDICSWARPNYHRWKAICSWLKNYSRISRRRILHFYIWKIFGSNRTLYFKCSQLQFPCPRKFNWSREVAEKWSNQSQAQCFKTDSKAFMGYSSAKWPSTRDVCLVWCTH